MTNPNMDPPVNWMNDLSTRSLDSSGSIDPASTASAILSALGFLTLLRLADRQDRTPARALGLFFATTTESIGGTVLGLVAIKRSNDSQHGSKPSPRGSRCRAGIRHDVVESELDADPTTHLAIGGESGSFSVDRRPYPRVPKCGKLLWAPWFVHHGMLKNSSPSSVNTLARRCQRMSPQPGVWGHP
jgi:hypothetical protein